MKKLVVGLIEFQKNIRPNYRETFAKLALEHKPDSLFIACSDSRVVPNLFASTDPGDLFVIRNVGNLVPPCGGPHGLSSADESEAAAIEFAVEKLKVKDIIICGHSECGAMHALLEGRLKINLPNLKEWLKHGEEALDQLKKNPGPDKTITAHNRLSQLNVLLQIEHMKSYPLVRKKLENKDIKIHAWWFELANASVHYYDLELARFCEITANNAEKVLEA